jgi:hypothetical protein
VVRVLSKCSEKSHASAESGSSNWPTFYLKLTATREFLTS